MTVEWRPETTLERELLTAIESGDRERCLTLLAGAWLLLPLREDRSGWVSWAEAGRTYLLAFTSPAALAATYGRAVPARAWSLSRLAERWPDPDWWLLVDPGFPIETRLPAAALTGHRAATAPGPSLPDGVLEPLPTRSPVPGFRPLNDVERVLQAAVSREDADAALSGLLLAELVVPLAGEAGTAAEAGTAGTPGGATSPAAGGPGWRVYLSGGEACVPVFTSLTRCGELLGPVPTTLMDGLAVVEAWPDAELTLAVNPGSPVGLSLPGGTVRELAAWAAEVGLLEIPRPSSDGSAPAQWRVRWQKLVPHRHVAHYLQRGYDLVSGRAHPVAEVAGIRDLPGLYAALGVDGSAGFTPSDPTVHLIRWTGPAHADPAPPCPGGVHQVRLAGMRLPHGAELWRRDRAGTEARVAVYDADARVWRPAPEGETA